MNPGILRTRLLPPRLPAGAVAREDLVRRVLDALHSRLVLVAAGPGWGKSTLLAEVVARLEGGWVWCSCDERLSSPGLLVAHLAAGIEERFPGFGAGTRLDGDAGSLVAEFCNELLATVPDDFVLVLDDVHLLPPATLKAVELLARDLPPTVRLAVATRADPPFALGGLGPARAVVLGEDALALTEGEARALLDAAGTGLDASAVAALNRYAEGWPAGLLLAAQAEGPLPDLAGDERLVEYLADEVLGRLPAPLQAFLLDLAVLERFTPEIAAAVSGRGDAEDLVQRLVADHIFTQRLGRDRRWFRFHQLFHAFLRRRLA